MLYSLYCLKKKYIDFEHTHHYISTWTVLVGMHLHFNFKKKFYNLIG